jgi:hypothetical protein
LILDTILTALKAERDRIARAIAALGGQHGTARHLPAAKQALATFSSRRRRRMSAEVRERPPETKKKWRAKKKGKAR